MDLGFAVLLAFFVLFVLGFPVVFAILIPSIAYIAWSGIPLATVAQRVLYALELLPAGRRAGVHLRRQPDERRGHHREDLSLRQHARRPPARRARAGEHRRQPDLLRRLRRGARRCRRHRPHRDQGDEGRGLSGAVRGGADRRLGHRRADLPAVDPGHHLCGRDLDLGDPAAGRRHHPGAGLRRHADDRDRDRRLAAQLSALVALADLPRAVDLVLAGCARAVRAGRPGRRHAVGLLHADRGLGGVRRLHPVHRHRVLSRDDAAASSTAPRSRPCAPRPRC